MNPPPEFMEAIERHLRLVDTLGMDHPETMRAMMLAMELAPQELKDKMTAKIRELGLIPEDCGYLDDGTPMYRLEDVAVSLGISTEKAEESMREITAEREAMGLSNDGRVSDAARIHWKQ